MAFVVCEFVRLCVCLTFQNTNSSSGDQLVQVKHINFANEKQPFAEKGCSDPLLGNKL